MHYPLRLVNGRQFLPEDPQLFQAKLIDIPEVENEISWMDTSNKNKAPELSPFDERLRRLGIKATLLSAKPDGTSWQDLDRILITIDETSEVIAIIDRVDGKEMYRRRDFRLRHFSKRRSFPRLRTDSLKNFFNFSVPVNEEKELRWSTSNRPYFSVPVNSNKEKDYIAPIEEVLQRTQVLLLPFLYQIGILKKSNLPDLEIYPSTDEGAQIAFWKKSSMETGVVLTNTYPFLEFTCACDPFIIPHPHYGTRKMSLHTVEGVHTELTKSVTALLQQSFPLEILHESDQQIYYPLKIDGMFTELPRNVKEYRDSLVQLFDYRKVTRPGDQPLVTVHPLSPMDQAIQTLGIRAHLFSKKQNATTWDNLDRVEITTDSGEFIAIIDKKKDVCVLSNPKETFQEFRPTKVSERLTSESAWEFRDPLGFRILSRTKYEENNTTPADQTDCNCTEIEETLGRIQVFILPLLHQVLELKAAFPDLQVRASGNYSAMHDYLHTEISITDPTGPNDYNDAIRVGFMRDLNRPHYAGSASVFLTTPETTTPLTAPIIHFLEKKRILPLPAPTPPSEGSHDKVREI